MHLLQSVPRIAVTNGVVFCTDMHSEHFIAMFVSILQSYDNYSSALIVDVYNTILFLLMHYKKVRYDDVGKKKER